VPAVQPPNTRPPEQIWHDLVHELGTVRALTAAALEARSEESRVALLMLLDAETDEVSTLLWQVRQHDLGGVDAPG
jgi:hypothetical protein